MMFENNNTFDSDRHNLQYQGTNMMFTTQQTQEGPNQQPSMNSNKPNINVKMHPISSTLDNRDSNRMIKASQFEAGQRRKWLAQDRASISSMQGTTNRQLPPFSNFHKVASSQNLHTNAQNQKDNTQALN